MAFIAPILIFEQKEIKLFSLSHHFEMHMSPITHYIYLLRRTQTISVMDTSSVVETVFDRDTDTAPTLKATTTLPDLEIYVTHHITYV